MVLYFSTTTVNKVLQLACLTFVTYNVNAWTSSSVPSSLSIHGAGKFHHLTTSSSSRTELFAQSHDSSSTKLDTESLSSSSSNRRVFFQQAGSKTAAVATLAFVSVSSSTQPMPALAAVDTNNNNDKKFYTPASESLNGKMILITGGTTGLGLESAKRLAYGGATVIITSRTIDKGLDAIQSIKEYLQSKQVMNDQLYTVQLDLDELENVRTFPERLQKIIGSSDKKIDVLMNNAGVMAVPTLEYTKDGYERTFQSNHLGHFLLTNKLMNLISPTNGRIINVSSSAHSIPGSAGLTLDNLNGEKEYTPFGAYGQSKLANILFSKELQKRLDNEIPNNRVTVVSLHPGAVQTDLGRYLIGTEKWEKMKSTGTMSFTDSLLFGFLSKFVLTVEEGASTQVYLAAAIDENNIQGGNYYDKCQSTKLEPFAQDMNKAQALWELSEKLTGENFQIVKK